MVAIIMLVSKYYIFKTIANVTNYHISYKVK